MLWPILLALFLVPFASSKVYNQCELARELKMKHGVRERDLASWICIAYHESRFDTAAINPYSGDHGIFQISEMFWCNKETRRSKACHINCSKLKDDDITDDFQCAKKIFKEHQRFQGDGFKAWVTYMYYCDQGRADIFIDGCF